jgi:hypothetical protein
MRNIWPAPLATLQADIHRCTAQLSQQAVDTLLGLLRHSWQSCRLQPENLSNDNSRAAGAAQQDVSTGCALGLVGVWKVLPVQCGVTICDGTSAALVELKCCRIEDTCFVNLRTA